MLATARPYRAEKQSLDLMDKGLVGGHLIRHGEGVACKKHALIAGRGQRGRAAPLCLCSIDRIGRLGPSGYLVNRRGISNAR